MLQKIIFVFFKICKMKKGFLTKTILILSAISFFTDVASEMLYPIIPIYLKSIGMSVAFIGILEGFAEALAGLSKGFFGFLVRKNFEASTFHSFWLLIKFNFQTNDGTSSLPYLGIYCTHIG